MSGSIAPNEFDWQRILQRNQATSVRNDRGRKDVWARFSKWFAWGTGSSGFSGFSQKHEVLVEREYSEYDHSSAFGYDHYLGEWIPFLGRSVPFADGKVPSECEEPVSPYDAARWSAITYFKQYVCRLGGAFARGEIFCEASVDPIRTAGRFVVMIPRTPGDASETATSRYYAEHRFQRISFGNPARRTAQIGPDKIIYDIPTTINSLLSLDHRTNAELVDAVDEFAATLQERIDDPASEVRGVVEVRRI